MRERINESMREGKREFARESVNGREERGERAFGKAYLFKNHTIAILVENIEHKFF